MSRKGVGLNCVIPLSFGDRTGHLPQLLRDVIVRIYVWTTKPRLRFRSRPARHDDDLRAKQGYTVAMAVEESRLLQGEHFYDIAQKPEPFEVRYVLPAVVTIADEVDAHLKQQMLRFMASDAAKAVRDIKVGKSGEE